MNSPFPLPDDARARLGQLALLHPSAEPGGVQSALDEDRTSELHVAAAARQAACRYVRDLHVSLKNSHVVLQGHCETYAAVQFVIEATRALRLPLPLEMHLDVPSYGSADHRIATQRFVMPE